MGDRFEENVPNDKHLMHPESAGAIPTTLGTHPSLLVDIPNLGSEPTLFS
jgi:hypothetical protein